MFYHLLSGVMLLLGALVALSAAKTLFRKGWFLGWLRGTLGFVLFVVAGFFALAGLDFFSYKAIVAEKNIAILEFTQVDEQKFKAKMIVSDDGQEHNFTMYGDQWQLDARVFKWPDTLSLLGVRPGYRLERISGRYYSLEQELNAQRSVYELPAQSYGVDLWHWAQQFKLNKFGIVATYGSATYLPMADGAQYEVSLSRTGLLARPFNESADRAVGGWQQ